VIAGAAVRTPLVRLQIETPAEIWLKLENLQPIGSFKIRGATNAIRRADREQLARGVLTASAGNMAQGVAWGARELGLPATIVAPDHIPQTKRAAIERLGGRVVTVPVNEWLQAIMDSRFPGEDGLFVHPVADERVMAGNGTIGLELLEDLRDPDAVLIPWGGGGLTTGIASAVKTLRPETRIVTVEPETAAPFSVSVAAGEPQAVEYRPSFVDGAGANMLVPGMWELARPLVDEAVTASIADTAAAVRVLAERARVVAEGAGALALAAALSGRYEGTVVCIVSGGNIDPDRLATILEGATP
jgi:threonine dehydratase